MTERKLRDYLRGAIDVYEALENKGFDAGGISTILNRALDDDPDVVKAARHALDKADRQISAEFSRGRQSAFLDMADWLQRTFHFVLTRDSWEWTE